MPKRLIFLLAIVLVLFSLGFIFHKRTRMAYVPTKYEEELISYFKEVALQSEYDSNPQKVIKWKKPMILYVVKERDFERQMVFIKKAIKEINNLATDEFKIFLTENPSESSSILYLCSENRVKELNPFLYEMLNDGIDYEISGLAYSEFDTRSFTIDKALIFIDSESPIEVQEYAILEEITQSLGLAFDSKRYPDSIFYKEKLTQEIILKEYSQMDRDIIRLLYHPKMKAGLDSIQLEKVIKKILKSEKD